MATNLDSESDIDQIYVYIFIGSQFLLEFILLTL